MITTRHDYLRTLIRSCTPTEPLCTITLAEGGRMDMRTEALLSIATRASTGDDFLERLVPEGAVVDAGSLGRGLLLLAHSVLDMHLHRTFAEERLAFDPALLTSLDWLELPANVRRSLAYRRVFALGDLLSLPADERSALMDADTQFSIANQLSRSGMKDLDHAGWPARHRIVPLAISPEGVKALRGIRLDHLPLPALVSHALELSLVERVSDLTAEQWVAVREVYALPADLAEETERVFADFGVDLTDVSLLQPEDDLFTGDD